MSDQCAGCTSTTSRTSGRCEKRQIKQARVTRRFGGLLARILATHLQEGGTLSEPQSRRWRERFCTTTVHAHRR